MRVSFDRIVHLRKPPTKCEVGRSRGSGAGGKAWTKPRHPCQPPACRSSACQALRRVQRHRDGLPRHGSMARGVSERDATVAWTARTARHAFCDRLSRAELNSRHKEVSAISPPTNGKPRRPLGVHLVQTRAEGALGREASFLQGWPPRTSPRAARARAPGHLRAARWYGRRSC